MVKSFIRGLFRFIGVIIFGLGIVLGVRLLTSPEPHESAFTHDEVAKINPVMIIDTYSLVHPENFQATMSDSFNRLSSIGVLVMTPFGPAVNPSLSGYKLNIIIQSGGGMVALGRELEDAINSLRSKGLKVQCYVGEAQSMAFYLMVTICDKVIAKRSARLMQHRVSYGLAGTTPSTYQSDVELSRKEAIALGVKYDEWHNLARGPEDHVFNLLEIEKYKLVDEWID